MKSDIEVHVAPILIAWGIAAAGCSTDPVERFDTPDGAMHALADAARSGDVTREDRILGTGGAMLLNSGDEAQDREDADEIARAVQTKLEFEDRQDGTKIARIGEESWPFPIPLVRRSGGWSFDALKGRDELDNRRIGHNELWTIETLHEYVDAQNEYRSVGRDGLPPAYAARVASTEGKHDGLYWRDDKDAPESPLGPLIAAATWDGPGSGGEARMPFHGYYYRPLSEQGACAPGGQKSYLEGERMTGGFALLAWPADYGESGVMSFVVCSQGVVYQKDLGSKTSALASEIHSFEPDASWEPVGAATLAR
jgi:hypothetical protein